MRNLYVLIGRSCSGKTSLINELISRHDVRIEPVSVFTNRKLRKDDPYYYFYSIPDKTVSGILDFSITFDNGNWYGYQLRGQTESNIISFIDSDVAYQFITRLLDRGHRINPYIFYLGNSKINTFKCFFKRWMKGDIKFKDLIYRLKKHRNKGTESYEYIKQKIIYEEDKK